MKFGEILKISDFSQNFEFKRLRSPQALGAQNLVGVQKYCVSALLSINGFKIGAIAVKIKEMKVRWSQKRQILYKKSSRKTGVRDIYR